MAIYLRCLFFYGSVINHSSTFKSPNVSPYIMLRDAVPRIHKGAALETQGTVLWI